MKWISTHIGQVEYVIFFYCLYMKNYQKLDEQDENTTSTTDIMDKSLVSDGR